MSTHSTRLQPTGFSRAPLVGLVALTAILGAWSWLRVEGTIFADAVEYLERAQAFIRGDTVVDAQKIRAAGVTLLHAPALWIADRLGIEDSRWVLPYAAACHVAISCLFVVVVVRLGAALGGAAGLDRGRARAAGLLGGIVAAVSPTFLQYTAVAMTDIAAGAALALGLERMLFGGRSGRSEARVGLQAGLGFALALLAAFKAIPLVLLGAGGALVASLFERGLRASLTRFGSAAAVVLVAALIQCAFDARTYGGFGSGLVTYALANACPIAGTFLWNVGLVDLGSWVYGFGAAALENPLLEGVSTERADLRSANQAGYYLDHFEWFSARWMAPAAALGALAAGWRAATPQNDAAPGRGKRVRFGRLVAALTPLAIALVFALVSSRKGAKDIRLWLPILPLFAAYAGVGLVVFAGTARSWLARPRAAVVALALTAAAAHGPTTLRTAEPRQMAALARAAQWLDDAVPAGLGRVPIVTASFHWSILFRTPPSWELTKLRHQLDTLKHESAQERAATLEELQQVDAVIVHAALLSAEDRRDDAGAGWAEELFDVLARDFHVAAAFWDREADRLTGFGPILVLTKGPAPGQRRRVLSAKGPIPGATAPLLRLERPLDGTLEELELAGARVTRLPGDGLFWAEFDVDVRGERVVADYVVATRVADASGATGFTTFRRPRWGKGRTSRLASGTRWTEGYLLAPGQGPQGPWSASQSPAGGSQVWLWWDLVTIDGDGSGGLRVTGRLDPTPPDIRRSPAYGALLIGSFLTDSEPGSSSERLRLESPLSAK